jgi:hypothetical protein
MKLECLTVDPNVYADKPSTGEFRYSVSTLLELLVSALRRAAFFAEAGTVEFAK